MDNGLVHIVGYCCEAHTHTMCVRCMRQMALLPYGEVTEYQTKDGVNIYLLGHDPRAAECQPMFRRSLS